MPARSTLSDCSTSSPRLRIMQVLASGGGAHGGMEKHFVDLCNSLSRQHEVIAVSHPDHSSGMSTAVHTESLGEKLSHRSPVTLFRMGQIIRRWKPDIIHAHAGTAASLISKVRFLTGARRIATVHGLKKSVRPYLSFDDVIAVSKGVAERIPHPRVHVIYNGIQPPVPINVDRLAFCREMNCSSDRPIAITLGRLVPVKGYDILINAWQGIDATLLIVGDGPDHSQLQQQINDAGLSETVRLIGFRSDVPRLLAHADLSVISSRREGFPYSLLEALAAQLLVVSTAVPGVSEVLPSKYLVPCENSQALHEQLKWTLSHLNEAREDFVPIWKRAAEEFTVEGMAERTAALYLPRSRAA